MVARGTAVPFSPEDISGLKVWLKIDSLSALNDGDPVSTWTDSSGNGNDFTYNAGIPSSRPLYRETGGPNSHPAAEFDGTNDVLKKLAFPVISQPDTIIIVFDVGRPLDAESANRQLVAGGLIYAGAVLDSGNGGAVDTFIVQSAIFNGVSSKIYRDGVETASGNAGTLSLSDTVELGSDGTSYNAGKLCELLIYDSGLSANDRGNVEAYLVSKYGI